VNHDLDLRRSRAQRGWAYVFFLVSALAFSVLNLVMPENSLTIFFFGLATGALITSLITGGIDTHYRRLQHQAPPTRDFDDRFGGA
jgi:hypothetical protein